MNAGVLSGVNSRKSSIASSRQSKHDLSVGESDNVTEPPAREAPTWQPTRSVQSLGHASKATSQHSDASTAASKKSKQASTSSKPAVSTKESIAGKKTGSVKPGTKAQRLSNTRSVKSLKRGLVKSKQSSTNDMTPASNPQKTSRKPSHSASRNESDTKISTTTAVAANTANGISYHCNCTSHVKMSQCCMLLICFIHCNFEYLSYCFLVYYKQFCALLFCYTASFCYIKFCIVVNCLRCCFTVVRPAIKCFVSVFALSASFCCFVAYK